MKNNIAAFIFFFTIVSISTTATAQDRHLDTLYSYQPAMTSTDDATALTGEGSFIHNNPNAGLIDEVMLYPAWQKGIVNFSNGKQLSDVELKFNLLKNELYFNNNGKFNYFADPVKSFSIFDTANQQNAVARFSSGYPHLGQKGENTYYLVLASGSRVHLLKYISKRKQDIYQYGGPAKTVYNFTEELLVYDAKANTLESIKSNTASIEKALPQYTTIIQQALKDKSSKNLSDEDLMETIKAINNKP